MYSPQQNNIHMFRMIETTNSKKKLLSHNRNLNFLLNPTIMNFMNKKITIDLMQMQL
jgi:hypothetical protein